MPSTTDPKSLVARRSDFPSDYTIEPVSGAPHTGEFLAGSGVTPVDGYGMDERCLRPWEPT
jgi:hypothetical protein